MDLKRVLNAVYLSKHIDNKIYVMYEAADINDDNDKQYQKRANTIKFNREVHRSE